MKKSASFCFYWSKGYLGLLLTIFLLSLFVMVLVILQFGKVELLCMPK